METSVRYLPRSGLVLVRDRGVTIIFRAENVREINYKLTEFGYDAVRDWRADNGQTQGYTRHASIRAVA